ncbi:hypothetical protein CSC82_03420 [Rhodobacteraceae bacterium 4F10]|nr:hypothetical protein CSC82_03420 [Rhodobacteraceae bacterium 4F10]
MLAKKLWLRLRKDDLRRANHFSKGVAPSHSGEIHPFHYEIRGIVAFVVKLATETFSKPVRESLII